MNRFRGKIPLHWNFNDFYQLSDEQSRFIETFCCLQQNELLVFRTVKWRLKLVPHFYSNCISFRLYIYFFLEKIISENHRSKWPERIASKTNEITLVLSNESLSENSSVFGFTPSRYIIKLFMFMGIAYICCKRRRKTFETDSIWLCWQNVYSIIHYWPSELVPTNQTNKQTTKRKDSHQQTGAGQ